MRIYISGPTSGYPEDNFPAFIEAAESLNLAGYTPVRPDITAESDEAIDWNQHLRRDLAQLLTCHGVATLPYWQNSRGCVLEVHLAQSLNMLVKPAHLWLPE